MEHRYAEPTLLMTDKVAGDEDAPEGVVGILTRTAPDLVAHLSVRARNLGLLFAACFADDEWTRLQALSGKFIVAQATPSGAVDYAEAAADGAVIAAPEKAAPLVFPAPVAFSTWYLPAEKFTRTTLGGKSNNLNLLRGKVPDWMKLPAATALPFGVAERVWDDALNEDLRKEMRVVLANATRAPAKFLPTAREVVLKLYPPAPLRDGFAPALAASGLPPVHWDLAWKAIKKVWASKWNERAFLSRRQLGMPHENLQMAVLIQQVVNAAYAFVIHTVNPISGEAHEVFAEVVVGLGETLVGNYPGSALGFTINKKTQAIRYLTFPGKSTGLFSPSERAVIFRSDSNGEDLAGFAGAGLYDSVLAEAPVEKTVDYTAERLLLAADFRTELCRKIGAIAMAVEDVCAAPQDIEGAITATGDYYIVQNRPQVGKTVGR
jgi:alpha-glucan,water dikinase